MKTTVKIIDGKRGYHLRVNGLYISQGFSPEPIKAIKSETCGVPYGATEWVSIQAIRDFWHKYMALIIASTDRPYKSVWGHLEFIPEPPDPEIGHAKYLNETNQLKSFDEK